MQKIETLIVGAGMAGLGCARTLLDSDYKDFAIVSKDIGGRVTTSADGNVNYGAFYMREDYKNIKKYAKKVRRIHPLDCRFFQNGKHIPYLCWKSIPHILSLVRLFFFLRKYAKDYGTFRRLSETRPQKEVIQEVPWFKQMYTRSAAEYIKEMHCEYWAEHFMNYTHWATAFCDIAESTGAQVAMTSLPFIVPTYEFRFDMDALTKGIDNRLAIDSVISIEKTKDGWSVKTEDGQHYLATHVIVTLPIHLAKDLITIPEPKNTARSGYMFHIKGTLREQFASGTYFFFDSPKAWFTVEPDGTVLLYSNASTCNLDFFFEEYSIIAERDWNPGFVLGPNLLESNRGDGLYYIGSHNAPTMEDSFTTGIYAANQVIEQ